MIDSLAAYDELRAAQFTDEQARSVIAIHARLQGDLATKADLRDLRDSLRTWGFITIAPVYAALLAIGFGGVWFLLGHPVA